jgi:transposase/5-methylcytosine-specific restriction endonuclease McrA
MPYAKYTREVLAEAVAASTSMAGVLRHLGLGQNGGAHAHLRRRIDRLGIDTAHFLGRAHSRGTASPRRRRAAEVLVMRPADARREAPPRLRRALIEIGRPYRCADCGLDGTWNGRPLTLHVDHIDGCFWDCRPGNLRFLCPNCHSQTGTYAGRNRVRGRMQVVRIDDRGAAVPPVGPAAAGEAERVAVVRRAGSGEITVADAARLLGCHRNHVYELRTRLRERGTLAPVARLPRIARVHQEEIVALALRNPLWGARKIAAELRQRPHEPIEVAHGTVANVLKRAGLSIRAARSAMGDAPEEAEHR